MLGGFNGVIILGVAMKPVIGEWELIGWMYGKSAIYKYSINITGESD